MKRVAERRFATIPESPAHHPLEEDLSNGDFHKPSETLSPERARQAKPLGHVRYVLAISLGSAVIAGVVIWLAFFV